jgi:hypothetical protein
MVDFQALNEDHIERMDIPESEKEHLRSMLSMGQTYVTVLSKQDIIFTIGYQRIGHDVAMIYINTDRANLRKYKRAFHKTVKLMEEDFKEVMGIRKLLATTPPNCHTSMRWLSVLGFQIEGVIKSFDKNGDHVLYGRTV